MYSQTLVDVTMGRKPADLVIRNGRWVCVQSGEIIPHTDVAVVNGRIAYVGPDAAHTIGEATRVIDAADRYLSPGLLDAHMHVESGMLTVTEFVRAVLPHGTTGMFVDPHEIANVLGMPGLRLMVDEAHQQPIHVYVQVPSCVPSAPGLETSGAVLGPAEVAEALAWPGVIGLGEVMNFPGVQNSEADIHEKMAAARAAGKIIGGHYPAMNTSLPFHAYAAGGPLDDHEGTRMEGAIARVRQGMRVMMRYGSAWHDVAEQVRAVTEAHLDPRYFLLCTDDSHSATLVKDGHMDRAIRHAVSQGLSPLLAIQMATINTAEYFGLSHALGLIAPGRWADIVLVKDLADFRTDMVIARGQVVAENGSLLVDLPQVSYPAWALDTVHLQRLLQAADFRLVTPTEGSFTANVIGIIENQAPTRHLQVPVQSNSGEVHPDMGRDLAKVALVERHRGSGTIQVGLVNGFGFQQPCAVATTVAHDSHQMIVVGTDEENMAQAANQLASMGGGQVVVCRRKVIGQVRLPVAGIISNEPAGKVAEAAQTVLDGFVQCGCRLNNPNMQLSLLGLVVIPELRISDKGLVDVNHFQVLSVLEKS
jgi:adenine deaminase